VRDVILTLVVILVTAVVLITYWLMIARILGIR